MIKIISVLSFLIGMGISNCFACDCDYTGSINHIDFYSYDVIQLVEVVGVYNYDENHESYSVNVRSLENFKNKDVSIFRVRNFGDCYTSMKRGEIWLVCAMFYDGNFNISYCGKSMLIEDTLNANVKRDLNFLRNPSSFPNSSVLSDFSMIDSTIFNTNMSLIHSIVLKKYTNPRAMHQVYFKAVLKYDGTLEKFTVMKNEQFLNNEIFDYYMTEISKIKDFLPVKINGNPINAEFIFPLPFP